MPSFLKVIFTENGVLGWQFFSFNTLKILFYFLFISMVSNKKSSHSKIIHLYVMCHSFPWLLSRCFLFLWFSAIWFWCVWMRISLSLFCLRFTELESVSLSFAKFGIFSQYVFKYFFCSTLFLSSFWESDATNVNFWYCPSHRSLRLCPVFFLPLFFFFLLLDNF